MTGLLLWLYSILKAWRIPINGDEIYTFEYYVKKGVIFLSSYNYIDANNHLLNTWLIELVYKIFGDHDFIIRIPNLLAQVLFLIYSAKLAMRLSTRVLTLLAFLILNLNPYINDYFMLARGYGISMALMMTSLYFACKFIEENTTIKAAFLSLMFAALALLANFTILSYVIILAFLLVVNNSIRNNSKEKTDKRNEIPLRRWNSLIILSPFSVLIIVVPILIKLRNAHALYAGGYSTDFWRYTVVSIIKMTFDKTPIVVNYPYLFEICIIVILIAVLAMIIYKIKTDKSFWKSSFLVHIFILIILCAIENILQHHLFDINYLYERTALMYIPLFTVLLIFLFENSYSIFKKTTMIIYSLLFIVLTINYFHVASLNRVIQHVWNPDLRDMENYLKQNHKEIPADKITLSIGMGSEFESDMNSYITTYFLRWLNRVDSIDEFNQLNDYFFIKKKDMLLLNNVTILREYPKSNMVLLENKKTWNRKEIVDKKLMNWVVDSTVITYIVDDSTINFKNAILNFKTIIKTKTLDQNAAIKVYIERNKKVFYSRSEELINYMVKENDPTQIILSILLPQGIEKGDVIKAFIYKDQPYPIYTKDMKMRIVSYY
jgi:hypothetical protein